jgi:hypothetical protein
MKADSLLSSMEQVLPDSYARVGFELRPNDTVVDIGGNIGVFVLWAAPQALDSQLNATAEILIGRAVQRSTAFSFTRICTRFLTKF